MPAPETNEELMHGLEATEYVYAPMQKLHAPDAHRLAGANIGAGGCNLTISFLSLNRANLSVRLIRSLVEQLPHFRGELLIIDQGSREAEKKKLRQACEALACKWRLVELPDNFGVAGGRNRTMPHVETDWIMSLDNDMVFVRNPLPQLQEDIAVLGCHFINLPLLDTDRKTLFAKGGHLYTEFLDGELFVGGGSVFRPVPHDGRDGKPFLSTFLFGGASVMRCDTFARAGQYDENMFIGFEDIDFSLRLFQLGYKVGNTRCVALVHDHPPPDDAAATDYERNRYSRQILKRSADYLERKHGVRIWSEGVDVWLRERQQQLGLGDSGDALPAQHGGNNLPAEPIGRNRPRVALVIDTEGWAFWNISQQIVKAHQERFDLEIHCTRDIDNAAQLFFGLREHDVIHVFWREYLSLLNSDHVRSYMNWSGVPYERFMETVVGPPVISTCVYDHLFLDEESLASRRPVYNDIVQAYYVGSNRLRDIYRRVPDFPDPAAVLADGVDDQFFRPQRLERFRQLGQRPVRFGWVGNSEWGDGKEDYKGVRTILRPAIEQLQAEGCAIELDLVDRAAGRSIPHRQMVDFYGQIDCYLCTSSIEGTPNPVLESMACGVPIITTDVGIVPDAFGPRQRDCILPERSVPALKTAIRRLLDEPDRFAELSAENLARVPDWYWRERVKGFADYFDECLRRRAAGTEA